MSTICIVKKASQRYKTAKSIKEKMGKGQTEEDMCNQWRTEEIVY